MKKVILGMTTFFLLCAMTTTAFATELNQSNVIYSGDTGGIVFTFGSEYSETDLFLSFKDVMPGDSLKQEITIKNDASNGVKAKIYMRSLGAHDDGVSEDFLSQMNLRVEKSEDNEMAYMFDAAADETAQLTDWVYLGTLYSGGEIDLDVFLDVSVEMDNQYANKIGYLDWEFMIEELPVEDSDPKPPKTGDESGMMTWAVIGIGSVALIIILLWVRRKKK